MAGKGDLVPYLFDHTRAAKRQQLFGIGERYHLFKFIAAPSTFVRSALNCQESLVALLPPLDLG